jgi:hypothetical protein
MVEHSLQWICSQWLIAEGTASTAWKACNSRVFTEMAGASVRFGLGPFFCLGCMWKAGGCWFQSAGLAVAQSAGSVSILSGLVPDHRFVCAPIDGRWRFLRAVVRIGEQCRPMREFEPGSEQRAMVVLVRQPDHYRAQSQSHHAIMDGFICIISMLY